MLPSLSLRLRLSLLLGAVLALGLTVGVSLLILHAGARIRIEADAATRLARDFVMTALPRIENSADPESELARMLGEARNLRHVRVFLDDRRAPEAARESAHGAPAWFIALALPRSSLSPIDLEGRGPLHGALVIAVNPDDEIAEIWEEVVWLGLGGVAIAFAAFALVSVAVAKTLRPVAALADGLARLERGDQSVRVPPGGPPEFVAIAERVNSLAATLERLDAENHQLVQRMIYVQDEERRDIARDLHDEIGPFLFAIRAGVGALARKGAAQEAALSADCRRIDEQLAALQQVNRRILGRLRPAALDEMGLAGALEALARRWRVTNPEISIELDVAGIGDLEEATALTAYRIAQEGLTNVFRHSGATRVTIKSTARPRPRCCA